MPDCQWSTNLIRQEYSFLIFRKAFIVVYVFIYYKFYVFIYFSVFWWFPSWNYCYFYLKLILTEKKPFLDVSAHGELNLDLPKNIAPMIKEYVLEVSVSYKMK